MITNTITRIMYYASSVVPSAVIRYNRLYNCSWDGSLTT